MPLKGVRAEHLADRVIGANHIINGIIVPAHFNSSVYGLVGDISSIDSDDAAIAGATGRLADAGHQHAVAMGIPVSVGTTNTEGSSSQLARRDHGHGLSLPQVRAVWSANTIVNDNTDAAIAFGGADAYDTNTMHNPATNNTRITFITAGVYTVGGYYVMEPDAQGARGIYILKNGATIIVQKKILTAVAGTAPNDAMEISVQDKFAANDYVELFAQNIASGANLNVTNAAFYATYQGVG
jgi:hypothetical protein